jgi:hypothetical protein
MERDVMAHHARVVAALALLLSVTVMRSAAKERVLPPRTDRSVAAEREPANQSDPPVAVAPITASWDLPPPLPVCQPVAFNFFAAFDAVSLAREIDENQVFATLNTPTGDVLNASGLSFDQEAGMRVVLGAKLTECYSIEITVMGLADWKDARAVSDSSLNLAGTMGNLFSPFTGFGSPPEVGLDFNDFASIRLVSSLDTFEWNVRQRLAALESRSFAATAIYGFRYLSIGEQLEYRTHSTLPLPAGSTSAVDVALDNHLYGFQLGAALDYLVAPWWINLEGKAAICHNGIVEEVAASMVSTADPPNAPIDRIREEGSTAFLGHLSATVELRFAENWIGRVGYQALLVEGLAVASRATSAELLHGASATYHGPVAGLIVTW